VSKLSNVQHRRLAGILTVSFGKTPVDDVESALLANDFAVKRDSSIRLTSKGERERERLLVLAGLNVEKK
jgi:hypothetical protein